MINVKKYYISFLIYFLLFGYFTLGKGFAYLHIPGTPIYIGEILLFSGFTIFCLYFKLYFLKYFKAISLYILWGLFVTLYFFPEYRIETLRDSAMYYYSFFAILIFTLLYNRQDIDWLWNYLLFTFKFVLIFHFIIKTVLLLGFELNINVPGTDGIKLYWMKFGDLGTLLAAGVVLLLIDQKYRIDPWNYIYLIVAAILVVMTLTINRGGFVAFVGGISVYLFYQSLSHKMKLAYSALILGVTVFLLLPSQPIDTERTRTFTKGQIISNVISIINPSAEYVGLTSTTRWRLMFWSDMINETVSSKEYLFLGQGLGPNLAGYLGYSPEGQVPNKHPHNFTINIFARMGILGLLFWTLINITYFLRLRGAVKKSVGKLRDLLIFFMAIWVAMLINSSFDVYLEGPMGAIPFWTFMGIGLWLVRIAHLRSKAHIYP